VKPKAAPFDGYRRSRGSPPDPELDRVGPGTAVRRISRRFCSRRIRRATSRRPQLRLRILGETCPLPRTGRPRRRANLTASTRPPRLEFGSPLERRNPLLP